MKRRTGAIVQTGHGYTGISFTLKDKDISDVQVYETQSLDELKENFQGRSYGLALDDSAGYLFRLSFPFSGKRRIGMVIRAEIDDLLPYASDDMVIGFKETDNGSVLAAAIPRTTVIDTNGDGKPRYIGLQSLSALYALKWAGCLSQTDAVLVHSSGSAVVILGLRNEKAVFLRQFIHTEEDDSFDQALREILQEPDYHPEVCVLVRDNEDRVDWKDRIERTHGIKVDIPALDKSVSTSILPTWLWSGLGAALIALSPKGQINLTVERQAALPGMEKIAFYTLGCLAALSILVWALSSLSYSLKKGAYEYLDSQPALIYKSIFPKSAQIKDVSKTLEKKIEALERQTPGTNGLSALNLLNELSRTIDSQIDVKVNDFTLDEKEFVFSGTTVSFAALEKIKSAVENLKGLAGVDLQNVELAPNKQVRFKVRGKL